MTSESTVLCRVGAGSFATVFTWQSRNGIVCKRVADPARCGDLRKEFDDVKLVHDACHGLRFGVPRAIRYYDTFAGFKASTGYVGDFEESLDTASLFLMERAWPLPPKLAQAIRTSTFPTAHENDASSFVARIYLGRTAERTRDRRAASRFFSPLNWPLDGADLTALGIDVSMVAAQMGRALSRIHHRSMRDGRDIEFVLGGGRDDYWNDWGLWCFDFNQMRAHDGSVDRLVASYVDNDPYFPRHTVSETAWAAFAAGYETEAVDVSQAAEALAREFISRVHSYNESNRHRLG